MPQKGQAGFGEKEMVEVISAEEICELLVKALDTVLAYNFFGVSKKRKTVTKDELELAWRIVQEQLADRRH